MKTTTVSQLKTSLSAYLRQVKTREVVLITEHGRTHCASATRRESYVPPST